MHYTSCDPCSSNHVAWICHFLSILSVKSVQLWDTDRLLVCCWTVDINGLNIWFEWLHKQTILRVSEMVSMYYIFVLYICILYMVCTYVVRYAGTWKTSTTSSNSSISSFCKIVISPGMNCNVVVMECLAIYPSDIDKVQYEVNTIFDSLYIFLRKLTTHFTNSNWNRPFELR